MHNIELELINWIKTREESEIRRDFPELIENMSAREQIIFMSGLNTFIYTHLWYSMRVNFRSIYERNRVLMAVSNDFLSIILSYHRAFQREYCYQYKEEIEEALAYIDDHLNEDLTLASLSAHVHISQNYLCKQFKRYTGMRFCQYVNDRRVEKAKMLLIHSSKPLDVIAEEVGYNSQTHFSTTFKRFTGKTPFNYRKQYRINK